MIIFLEIQILVLVHVYKTITMSFPTGQEARSTVSLESVQPCRQLTFSEIQLATQNFDESLVIGRGGFGKVYKGTITNGASLLVVAIKRLDSNSNQGAVEFWAEVEMLSKLRHCHLVSLIGYCNDGQEMILVYEYMPHGTLEDHLHKRQTLLSWERRLKICIGAARGLDYLHTGTGVKHGVIHRDVKSSNILLDESWAAKISDFGLSKIGPTNQPSTYVNTFIKGTFGYLDPDYFSTGRLTRKSDVYAFGVVLFEVLCGKRAVDRSLDEELWGLASWVQDSIKEGRLKQIVDTNIRERISPKCLKDFARLANRCLHSHPKQRPTMAEVVAGLESALALQDKANHTLHFAGMTIFGRKVPLFFFTSNGEYKETVEMGVERQCNEEDVVNTNRFPSILEEAIEMDVERQCNEEDEDVVNSNHFPSILEESAEIGMERRCNEEHVVNSNCFPLILEETVRMGMKRQCNEEDVVNSNCFPSILEETVQMDMERQCNEEDVVNSECLPSSVLEVASSSLSPKADDSNEDDSDNDAESADVTNNPIPTIHDLRIVGEAFPGHELQVCGYSSNGTTSCYFNWIRHLKDGSFNYIEGAKKPIYTITADDIDTYLSVEVQPCDDRKIKGEIVKCFANDHMKITCHPDMLCEIKKFLIKDHVSFKLSLGKGFLDIWEPATLEIKRSSYIIKLNGPNSRVIVNEKYTPTTVISLPAENPLEFSIINPGGVEQNLRADYNSNDVSCSRDTIVLTMKLFIKQAIDMKLEKKKKGAFFFK